MHTVNGTLYRVIEMIVQPADLLPARRTLWLGEDLDQLAEAYPEHDLFVSDLSEVRTGSVIRIIERQLENGRWDICEYPRITRVDPVVRADLIYTAACLDCLDSGCYHCMPNFYSGPRACLVCMDPLFFEDGDSGLCSFCVGYYAMCGLCGNVHTDPMKKHDELCSCCERPEEHDVLEQRWFFLDPDLGHTRTRQLAMHKVGKRTFVRR